MRLANYTDYTLRVLMFCASNPDRLVSWRRAIHCQKTI